ncbi:MAG: SdrD B-like domain-containing protein, partial [Verrucomicrobiota bacterium]
GGVDDVLIEIDYTTGSYIPNAFGPGIDYVVLPGFLGHSDLDDIAIDPADGQMYGILNNGGINDRLILIDRVTGATADFGALGINDSEGLSFDRNANLFGCSGAAGTFPDHMFGVNKTNGAAVMPGLDLDIPIDNGSDYESISCLTCVPNEINGTVYFDLNTNAVLNGNEPGTPNVTVNIYRDVDDNGIINTNIDVLLGSQLTDSNGFYAFVFNAAGPFLLNIETNDLLNSHFLTTDNLEIANYAAGVYGVVEGRNDFGWALPASLTIAMGDRVWLDENSNGIEDAGEAGIPNVVMQLYDAGNNPIRTTVTDSEGFYLFTGIPAGLYTIEVASIPAGLEDNPTFDPDGVFDNRTTAIVIDTEGVFSFDFGYNWVPGGTTGPGAIGDQIWIDANGDGIHDPGEPGFSNRTVRLFGDPDGNGVFDTPAGVTLSDRAGNYIFD